MRLFSFLLFCFLLSNTQATFAQWSFGQLDSLFNLYKDESNYTEALKYAQLGLAKAEKEGRKEDSTYAQFVYNQALVLHDLEQYPAAEANYKKAMELFIKIWGKDHRQYSRALNAFAILHDDMGKYELAEKYYLECLALSEKILGKESEGYTNILNNIAVFYDYQGKYELAEKYHLENKVLREKALGKLHYDYTATLNNLAALYRTLGKLEESEAMYLEAKDLRAKILGKESPAYAGILNNLANLYLDMNLYAQAELLYLEARSIRAKQKESEPLRYASTLNNLAVCYLNQKKYREAELMYLEVKDIRKKILGTDHHLYALILGNLASLYVEMNRYEQAEPFFLETRKILEKAVGKEHPDYAIYLSNLADLYKKTNRLQAAETVLLEARDIVINKHGKQHINYSFSALHLGQLYTELGQFDKSYQYLRESILANIQNGEHFQLADSIGEQWSNQLKTAEYGSFLQLDESLNALYTLINKQQNQSLSPHFFHQQEWIERTALAISKKVEASSFEEKYKLRVLSKSHIWAVNALGTAKFKSQGASIPNARFSEIFEFAEMSKAALLARAVQAERNYVFGGLPDSLFRKEKQMQEDYTQKQAEMLENKSPEKQVQLQNELNNLNLSIKKFKTQLSKDYPQYYAGKDIGKHTSIEEIQQQLSPDAALLEYVVGESMVYLFYISKKEQQLYSFSIKNNQLKEKIQLLHKALSDYETMKEDPQQAFKDYSETAFWFYENILSVALHDPNINHLLIIPDAELAYLPFETFLRSKANTNGDYSQLDYLLKYYKISYNYSAALWKENLRIANKNNNAQVLAMASSYDFPAVLKDSSWAAKYRLPKALRMRQNLLPLPSVRLEIEKLAQYFSGDFLLDTAANEAFFKENAHRYSIIHLAMHGILNKKEPILSSLAFTENGDSLQDNFLQAYEISKMKLNADLVVLSACETGFGKFEKGEGVMSLARSFMYVGVPSLVVSLWSVNDASTAGIMSAFYENLAAGKDKAAALQQAKLQYLSNAKGLAAHPAFWSAFVQLGDERAIKLEQKTASRWWLWAVAGAVGSFLLFVFVKKMNKNY